MKNNILWILGGVVVYFLFSKKTTTQPETKAVNQSLVKNGEVTWERIYVTKDI